MDKVAFFIICLTILYKCYAVPPTPTDRLWEELTSAKTVMTNIASQLEKFNSLYLMKLEQRMTSIASTLANIDSNVKNLQERAHVWDTFQLHVSAWNEQLNTLDKKVDIISKGQEKMFILDSKLNTISNIEYKSERIIGKLDDNLATVQTIIKIIESQHHDPLLGEFTTRGVLSTLKTIERKLDKLQMAHSNSQSMLAKQLLDNKRESMNQEGQQKNKLMIKCNTPPIVEELLSDVASKVDVMFDKFTGHDEQSDESSGDDRSSEMPIESKSDPDLKLIKGLLKRLNQPCKRTIKVLENLETSIRAIDNTTIAILEDEQLMHSDLLTYCKIDRRIPTSEIIHKIDSLLQEMDRRFVAQQEALSIYFNEQREQFSGIVQSEIGKTCTNKFPFHDFFNKDDKETMINEYYDEKLVRYSNKYNCEELDITDQSGVYVLGPSEFKNIAGRSYNIRYCEFSSDAIWTVIQRRGLNPDYQSFNLSWSSYKNGFGSLNKDFWFGNDFIYNLSDEKPMLLRIELEDFEGNTAWAEYNTFTVGNEDDNYKLKIGSYEGNASDSFSSHYNSSFSTYDRTNDQAPVCCPCATSYGGGWWFNSCFEANLNGIYHKNPILNDYYRGLIWEMWLGNYSLKRSKMMVRPKIMQQDSKTEIEGSGNESTIDSTMPWNETDIPDDP